MLAPVVYSFSRLWLEVLPEEFTHEEYARSARDPKYLEAALLSLCIALLAVLLNVLVGMLNACAAHLWAGRGGIACFHPCTQVEEGLSAAG